MTMMQKHKSIHKTVASEDTLNAIEYWSDLYKNKDRNENEQMNATNEFSLEVSSVITSTLEWSTFNP